MIKMKKKWIRGGVSLALVAVLSLSSVMSVRAALSAGSDDDAHSGNTKYSYTEKSRSVTNQTVSSPINQDNDTTFDISIPKTISVDSPEKYENGTAGKSTFNYYIKYDLAPTQVMTVRLGDATHKVTINNHNGRTTGSARTLTTYANTLSNQDMVVGDSAEGDGVYVSDWQTYSGVLTNDAAIRAGHWKGTLDFTVSITQEVDDD